ncbi:MAG: hypothetical protein KAW93_03100, partial [Methanogenium sp.]|nr:hypothetical protein [Methanogenium sp.]
GVEKDLKKTDNIYLESIFSRIEQLSSDPVPQESKKISASENFYRIRSVNIVLFMVLLRISEIKIDKNVHDPR